MVETKLYLNNLSHVSLYTHTSTIHILFLAISLSVESLKCSYLHCHSHILALVKAKK